MNALRRARRFGRLVAVWLLLSFIAMGAAPIGLPRAADAPVPETGTPAHAHRADAHAHGGHDHADPGEPDARPDTGRLPSHAGHAAGSVSHCPLCMHAAAPPPPQRVHRLAGEAPDSRPAAVRRSAARVRTAAPPPGRGPPALS